MDGDVEAGKAHTPENPKIPAVRRQRSDEILTAGSTIFQLMGRTRAHLTRVITQERVPSTRLSIRCTRSQITIKNQTKNKITERDELKKDAGMGIY